MRNRRFLALLVAAVLCTAALAGCTSVITGTGTSDQAPPANFAVVNDARSNFDQLVKNAISDVTAFWRKSYPSVSGGKSFPELTGGFYSVDSNTIEGGVDANGCLKRDKDSAIDNAFYCRVDDSVAWDRNEQHLVAQLGDKYGPFLVAVVFAHEFGHVIQAHDRLAVFDQRPKTILTESQADCAAGAWIRSVQDATPQEKKALHFSIDEAELDQALLGFLQVRDSTPTDESKISHGNGFDRLAAIADGIDKGVTYCFDPSYIANRRFTERPFTTDDDYQAGGNETFEQVIDDTAGTGGGLQPDLNRFWKAAAESIKMPWADVKTAQGPAPCKGTTATEFTYCESDNTVYYTTAFAMQAYNSLPDLTIDRSTFNVTVVNNAPADYSLGTLYVFGWGLAVRHQLFAGTMADTAALSAASCYAGAYSASINVATAPAGTFQLSPPDMDEATAAIIQLVPLDKAYGARGTTSLQRIQSFTKGYFGGLSVC